MSFIYKVAKRITDRIDYSDILDKGIKKCVKNEVDRLECWTKDFIKQGRDQYWTSRLTYNDEQFSKEVRNYIRNKSLEIFLKRHKDIEIVKSESGWDYEQYNVLIKVKNKIIKYQK